MVMKITFYAETKENNKFDKLLIRGHYVKKL